MGVPALTAIGTILGGLGSVITAVSSFKAPKIEIPKVELPQADLEKINQAIEANKSLSDTARQTIQQAVQLYNEGKLTPYYQATLDRWWNDTVKQINQRLASLGLSQSSIADAAIRDAQSQYLENYGKLLNQQLSTALQLTGISQEYYNELMNKAQLQLQGKIAEAQSYVTAASAAQQAAAQKATGYGSLLTALGKLPETLGQFGDIFGTKTTAAPEITLQPPAPKLEEPQLTFSGKLDTYGY